MDCKYKGSLADKLLPPVFGLIGVFVGYFAQDRLAQRSLEREEDREIRAEAFVFTRGDDSPFFKARSRDDVLLALVRYGPRPLPDLLRLFKSEDPNSARPEVVANIAGLFSFYSRLYPTEMRELRNDILQHAGHFSREDYAEMHANIEQMNKYLSDQASGR